MNAQYKDCYASLTKDRLTIGNGVMERSWNMTGSQPVACSLMNKQSGKEWITTQTCTEWVAFPGSPAAFYRKGLTTGGMRVLGLTSEVDDDCGVGMPHLRVCVDLEFGPCKVHWFHLIYPELPVVRSFLQAEMTGQPQLEERPEEWPDDVYDHIPLALEHGKWKCVAFTDKSDDNDNLVNKVTGILSRREFRSLAGNLFFAEDSLTGEGVTLVKEGPAVTGRLPDVGADFRVCGMELYVGGWGFDAADLQRTKNLTSYGSAVMLWQSGEDAALDLLHKYHRAVRTFVPERDALIMANTWGDGNADGRIGEDFLMRELKRAGELGINYFQIDDGWQQGTTSNSVNAKDREDTAWGEGYYKADPEFWAVNPTRLPNGLEPLVKYAEEHEIMLGLWFSPDSMDEFSQWERDSEVLLNLHRRYGIRAFKMDGLIYRSKLSEENFGRLMRRVVKESGGKVFFNLDTTAGVRNGYFGRVQYGNLFLENRFTNNFGHWPNYWPYRTLRNLWMLSRYLPTERLQVEFLNVANNIGLYKDDVLSPAACGQEYVFALSLFASPLAWMELSVLPNEAAAQLKKDIEVYRKVQAELLQGHVLPIGEEPDGTQWTGFQSVGEGRQGYLLILREYNSENSHTYRLHGLEDGELELESLIGSGSQTKVTVRNGCAEFTLPSSHGFALYRYKE